MTKRLNISAITNDLEGSAFFSGQKPLTTADKPSEAFTSLLANQQTSKPTNLQTSKLANQQVSKPVSQQTNEQPLTTKEKRKYGTYLSENSIIEIQVHAVQTKRKDHEVLQEAVDFYFQNLKK